MEKWKDIDGFPDYKINSEGKILRISKNYYLKPCLDKSIGYFVVNLYDTKGRPRRKFLHRLIAEAFIPNPENKRTVNHIDGNKSNNELSNLEWATDSENMLHAFSHGLCENTRKSAYKQQKILSKKPRTENQIESARRNITLTNKKRRTRDFLYFHQKEALKKMFNGCVLNGTVGSGKSRVGLYYYFQRNGGSINPEYIPMTPRPMDLYILTTAKKRNDLEWEGELSPFLLSTDPKQNKFYGNKIVVDSWQNIKKYDDVENAFFIFDENKINGKGVWAKSFLKITKHNEWIILSASNGDRIEDYETLFIAEGFVKNRTEFREQFLVYSRYTNFPMVTGYRNERRFFRCRDKILIDMDFKRKTIPHHEDIFVEYDHKKYKDVVRTRWDIYKDEPIQQASGLCLVLRRVVNEDPSRENAILDILKDHPKAIIFYNFDTELEILLNISYQKGTKVAQYNGHKHEPIPKGNKWVYLVNYNACEAWNTTRTNCMIFYSQNYSYKVMLQASGRIDRLNTPYTDLYYYHLKSRSGIDLAISRALSQKKKFNERKFAKWD